MRITKYKELIVWQESIELAKLVYKCSSKFGRDVSLRDQIQRAAVSVSSNIVEGFERNGTREFVRYLRIAKGSLGEVRSQIYLAKELGYISGEEHALINEFAESLSYKIGALIKYLRLTK